MTDEIRPITDTDMLIVDDVTGAVRGIAPGGDVSKNKFLGSARDPLTGLDVLDAGSREVILGSVPVSVLTEHFRSVGQSDQRLSMAKASVDYADNLGTQFKETWANMDAWAKTTNAVQVSGGKLFSGTVYGGANGMNKSFPVTATGKMRAVFDLNYDVRNGGGIIIGVSSDAAGATPASAGANVRGLYFKNAASGVKSWTGGVEGATLGLAPTTGRYIVTVMADDVELTVTARKVDGTREYRFKWARAGFDINNLFIFNSDANQLTGGSVGFVGASYGFATVASRTGVEGVGVTVFQRSNGLSGASLQEFRVALPANYDSRIPSPVVWFFHGSGTGATDIADNDYYNIVGSALNAAGFIVASCNFASKTTWGAQGSLDTYYALYKLVRENFNMGPGVVFSNSMGGIESLLTLAQRKVPNVVAWLGTVPTTSLASAYSSASFTSAIDTAYGITGTSPNTYAEKTAGYDPMLLNPALFRGLPMYFLATTNDVVIPIADNSYAFVPRLSGLNEVTTNYPTSGGHGVDPTPYVSAIVAFLSKYVAA